MLIYACHFRQVIVLKGGSLLEIPGICTSAWISLRLRNGSSFVGSCIDKSLTWSLSWILSPFCLLLPKGQAGFQGLAAQVGAKKRDIQVLRGTQKSACGFAYSLWCFGRSWAILKTCNWLWALSPLEKSGPWRCVIVERFIITHRFKSWVTNRQRLRISLAAELWKLWYFFPMTYLLQGSVACVYDLLMRTKISNTNLSKNPECIIYIF